MWELLTGPSMMRLVVYSTISYMLSSLGILWDDSKFWCFIALIWVLEYISSSQTRTDTIEYLMSLPKMNLYRLKDMYDQANNNSHTDVNEIRDLMKKEEKDADE